PPVINPPFITILQPSTGRGILRVHQNYLLVKGRVEDEYGISSFQVNKRKVKLDSNGYFSHNARIRKNQQKINVFAKSRSGKSARVSFNIQKMPSTTTTTIPDYFQKPVLWGLLIGVSDYADNNLDLEFADADAKALGAFLKKQKGKLYSNVYIKTLVNRSVTRESVLNNIARHLGKASLNDVAFLFLAGHGVQHAQTGSYYFLPHDANHNNLVSKGLNMAALSDSVKILTNHIKRVIVATDTCHAGALQVGARSAESGKDISALFQASQGLFLLSASKSGENSLENRAYALYEDGPGHGAFTSSLILGMKGEADTDKDGSITISELFQYVSKRVPMLTNGLQHPYFRIDGTDMPLILR
ncbi:caspase family protein, partial [Desulfobacterales bacterium HSG16]|nr:caspase family protein [Desulfobacterales bacterium HSG16]